MVGRKGDYVRFLDRGAFQPAGATLTRKKKKMGILKDQFTKIRENGGGTGPVNDGGDRPIRQENSGHPRWNGGRKKKRNCTTGSREGIRVQRRRTKASLRPTTTADKIEQSRDQANSHGPRIPSKEKNLSRSRGGGGNS